jgi:hypothetical protein
MPGSFFNRKLLRNTLFLAVFGCFLNLQTFATEYEFKSYEMLNDLTIYWWWLIWLGGVVLTVSFVTILFVKKN